MTTRYRLLIRFILCLTICAASTASFGANKLPSGSCVNDVGRGALLWGTSDEVTTYSAPYLGLRSPQIYRIPLTSESTTTSTGNASETPSSPQGNWREKLKEVGTIYGTDGKVYEYYFVEGKEPRRIVETQRVHETPKGGVAPVWYNKTVERIEWEPVLIRVLRPVGTTERQLRAETTSSQKSSASSSTPAPCEPLGSEEPRTFADDDEGSEESSGVKLADTSNGITPSVVGAERRDAENAAIDAANNARASSRDGAKTADASSSAQSQEESPTFANGIVRVIIPDRAPSPAPQPLVVLPKSLEKLATTEKSATAKSKTTRR